MLQKTAFLFLITGLLVPPMALGDRKDVDAEAIVARADRIRFPEQPFQVDIDIVTTAPDAKPDARSYRTLSKGNENTVVQVTAPAIDRGQILLMKDHDLWVFMPQISQPIRLPLSQRLTGQVANGDLARANFKGDYTPTFLRMEEIDGIPHYVLELNANDRYVTYHRVLYWVNRKNDRPYKAEFYTRSGRLLKTAYYSEFRKMQGAIRPTKLVMIDALREGEQSVLKYSNMKLRKLPDKLFTKDYLKKLH